MNLTIGQRSNIRHFIYYLVNGTLDFDRLNNHLSVNYHDYLKTHPELFYKTSCVFINQEVKLNPSWPEVNRLAEFICKEIAPEKHKGVKEFESWELDFQIRSSDLSGSFKAFSKLFIESAVIEGMGYTNYIEDGASFVEQCFAIWANVIEFEDGQAKNFEHATSRVTEYKKSYYDTSFKHSLEDWEFELYME
ncbi:MAG: hypothetical protein EOP48_12540 [Sphingobacteriales bacterium]|nr:MAG: hypothetical protein EOP48_12540 [Sphingobacteriales bacterium]